MQISVVGLGKIGLPLVVQFASKGHRVIGSDRDPGRVAAVLAGEEPFPGEPGMLDGLRWALAAGSLHATTDTAEAVAASQAVVIVVPLIVDPDGRPDFGALDDVTARVGDAVAPGTLVSYETTLPLGTTRHRFLPVLSERSGLTVGTELFVAFSPERVSSGSVFRDLRRYPKLVGGVDAASARRATEFYASVLDFDARDDLGRPNGVWDLGSTEAAELAKLAETTYRDVNIALANELAIVADDLGVDALGVIDACNSQPYSHIHRPGIAVGGHCIPVYPRLLMSTHPTLQVPAASRRANESMPRYAIDRLEAKGGPVAGRAVVVLGAAYRGGVQETAFSGVFPLVAELRERGADVRVHDPLYDDEELAELGFTAYHLGEPVSLAVVQADHDEYRQLAPTDLPGVEAILDGRRVLPADGWDGVARVVLGGPTDG